MLQMFWFILPVTDWFVYNYIVKKRKCLPTNFADKKLNHAWKPYIHTGLKLELKGPFPCFVHEKQYVCSTARRHGRNATKYRPRFRKAFERKGFSDIVLTVRHVIQSHSYHDAAMYSRYITSREPSKEMDLLSPYFLM